MFVYKNMVWWIKLVIFLLPFLYIYNLLTVSSWKVEKRRWRTTFCFYYCTFRCIKVWLFDKLCHHGTSFAIPEHHEVYFYYCLLYVGRAVPLESGDYGTSEEPGETQRHTPILTVTTVTKLAGDDLNGCNSVSYQWPKQCYTSVISHCKGNIPYLMLSKFDGMNCDIDFMLPDPLKLRKRLIVSHIFTIRF